MKEMKYEKYCTHNGKIVKDEHTSFINNSVVMEKSKLH